MITINKYDLPAGTIFKHEEWVLEVVTDKEISCKKCFFRDIDCNVSGIILCDSYNREDKIDVNFVEVKR